MLVMARSAPVVSYPPWIQYENGRADVASRVASYVESKKCLSAPEMYPKFAVVPSRYASAASTSSIPAASAVRSTTSTPSGSAVRAPRSAASAIARTLSVGEWCTTRRRGTASA